MYEIIKSEVKIIIKDVSDFDPDQIFDCGQCFRWKKDTESENSVWYGVVGEDFARLSFLKTVDDQEDTSRGDIIIESYKNDERFWLKYLDLERDYETIKMQLSKDDLVMQDAVKEGEGIRILRQDVWETLISFIISQNSNIPRIQSCIDSLCVEFGKEIGEYKGEKIFSFPGYEILSKLKEDDLKPCRLGYRARYIAEAARQVEGDGGAVLDVAASMADNSILKYLLSISGVGPKVASCIMLFSMGKLNVFPIDVWVKRVMNRLYLIGENDIDGMKEYAGNHFGKYGGIAQQYLFNYIRRMSTGKPELYESLKLTEEPKETES